MTLMKMVIHPPLQTKVRENFSENWYQDMVNVVEETKDKPNQLDKFGEAPLCIAAHNGKGFVVENLLQQSNIKVNIQGKHGRTPLYLAAEGGHVYVVKCLLSHPDIDVNARNAPGGATALMAASRKGYNRIVQMLLQVQQIMQKIIYN